MQLTVEYHKPLPANSTVVCTSELESANGRKVWMKATVMDADSKAVYASGRALFVTPKIKVRHHETNAAMMISMPPMVMRDILRILLLLPSIDTTMYFIY